MHSAPEQCYITNLKTQNIDSERDLIEYRITVDERNYPLAFFRDYENSEAIEKHKHFLHGLILNGKFPLRYNNDNDQTVITSERLEAVLKESMFPKSPEQKAEHLLQYLHSLQEYEGSRINLQAINDQNSLALRLYFKNRNELVFYLFTLKSMGFVDGIDSHSHKGRSLTGTHLTYKGLAKVIEIKESGSQSDRCFIAMSFSKDLNPTRDALKAAIKTASFQPILIDEIHYDSEVTINDALLAEIKKCKFLVADFTEHKHGVYFEAGFALGLKKPVIYVCHKDDFANTHFDLNHYPHIIYENLIELTEKLTAKIEAWID